MSLLHGIEKNNTKLENLMLIGYSPVKVSMPYQLLTVGLNILVLIMAFVIMLSVRSIYMDMFQSFFPDFEAPGILLTVLIGIVYF